MKTLVEMISGYKVKIAVEIEPADYNKKFDEIIKRYANKLPVRGFRHGHAPKELVLSYYKNEISAYTVDELVNDGVHKAFEDNKLTPVSKPEIDIAKLEDDKIVRFTIISEVLPKLELKDYFGIEVEIPPKREVTDEEINNVLKQYQEDNARLVPVENRKVCESDVVGCSLTVKSVDDNKEVEKIDDISIEVIRANHIFPGLSQILVDSELGQELVYPTKFPELYGNDLKDKKAEVIVQIKNIKEKKLPPLDDEFAHELGDFKSIDEVRNDIKIKIEKARSNFEGILKEGLMLEKIIEMNPFEVPPAIIERYIQGLKEQYQNRSLQKKASKEEEISDSDHKTYQQTATKMAKRDILLRLIAEKEGFEISDDEVDQEIKKIISESKDDIVKIQNYYKDKKNKDDLKYDMKMKKTMDVLLRYTRFHEKSPIETGDLGVIQKPYNNKDQAL